MAKVPYAFKERLTAVTLKRMAREYLNTPQRNAGQGPTWDVWRSADSRTMYPGRKMSPLKGYLVTPLERIPGAKRIKGTDYDGQERNKLLLGTGLCALHRRDSNDLAESLDENQDGSHLTTENVLDEDTGAYVTVRVYNFCPEDIDPTGYQMPSKEDCLPILFVVQDPWGDLYIVKECEYPCSSSSSIDEPSLSSSSSSFSSSSVSEPSSSSESSSSISESSISESSESASSSESESSISSVSSSESSESSASSSESESVSESSSSVSSSSESSSSSISRSSSSVVSSSSESSSSVSTSGSACDFTGEVIVGMGDLTRTGDYVLENRKKLTYEDGLLCSVEDLDPRLAYVCCDDESSTSGSIGDSSEGDSSDSGSDSSGSGSGSGSSLSGVCIDALGGVKLSSIPGGTAAVGGFVLGIDEDGCLVKYPISECEAGSSSGSE